MTCCLVPSFMKVMKTLTKSTHAPCTVSMCSMPAERSARPTPHSGRLVLTGVPMQRNTEQLW